MVNKFELLEESVMIYYRIDYNRQRNFKCN